MIYLHFQSKMDPPVQRKGFRHFCMEATREELAKSANSGPQGVPNDNSNARVASPVVCCAINVDLMESWWWCSPVVSCRRMSWERVKTRSIIIK